MAPMPRSATTRAQTARPDVAASQYNSRLHVDPSLIPPGEEWQWIREATLGQPDFENVDARLDAGWTPVTTQEAPRFKRVSIPGRAVTDDLVRRGGLMLVKRPKEIGDAERAALAQQNKQILASVDKDRRASVHGQGVSADHSAFEGVRSTIDNGRFPDA